MKKKLHFSTHTLSHKYTHIISLSLSHTHTHSHTLSLTHTHTLTHTFFIFTLSLIRPTACARAQFSGCSSTTNAHSETGQMAVYCQNLPLGAPSSRIAPSVLVGALFKKFGLILNTPRIVYVDVKLNFLYAVIKSSN